MTVVKDHCKPKSNEKENSCQEFRQCCLYSRLASVVGLREDFCSMRGRAGEKFTGGMQSRKPVANGASLAGRSRKGKEEGRTHNTRGARETHSVGKRQRERTKWKSGLPMDGVSE